MFREVITVKWKDSYTATKIPLSKEISNVSNSYHIRIQAYELEQRIDGKTVFILQLKHNRNVRNVGSTAAAAAAAAAAPIGISMHNEYRMKLKRREPEAAVSRRRDNINGAGSKRSSSYASFFDEIWLQHESAAFLHATVNTIFRAFDCDDFIQYNEHTNQFEFNFEAKQNMTTLTKYVSLSRIGYTKEEAETLLKDRHHAFETIKPCKVQVCCVNSHEIEDKDWDFEVNLTLLPGKYEFCINELFGKIATQIHARDYPRIRHFYFEKLKSFVSKRGIFNEYLTHLSTFEPRYKMMEWSKNGVESGPLFGLYSILCEVKRDDAIWDNLFEICLRDKIDDKMIRNSISEQTVADFIALSLKHYVKDSVKRRIQIRETQLQKEKQKQIESPLLSESDRYILSIILPYFGSPPLSSIHKWVANESLPSGLFNRFCDELNPIAMASSVPAAPCTWGMKVEPLKLKNKLLKHLYEKGYDVVKQYYVAVYQHVPAVEKGDKTRWTFYIRPSTYAEIFNGKHKINMNAYTFTDKFEFKERQMPNAQYLNLIIKCVDVSFECDWAMWTRRKLKLYAASLGYWKILSTFDETPRVPVDHLDCVLALLRHDAMSISPKLLRNENQSLSVVFLQATPDNKWSTKHVEAEYQLTYWNGKQTGNSSLSLRLIQSAHPGKLTAKAAALLRKRDSHFIHYRSRDEDIEWLWYDNDDAKYREYKLGCNVPKQLEATYLGVSEEIFPQDETFNCAQIPEMTAALQKKMKSRGKPFVLRFTFQKHGGKIINIEQLAINSYYDQFPRNVKRVYSGKSGVKINDEEQRVSSLGEMNIYQSNKSIIICWKFAQNAELGIAKTYHYKVQIPIANENKFKRLLMHWRRNTLFDQTMSNRAMSIVQSRMWKTDHKMPPIRDITVDDLNKKPRAMNSNNGNKTKPNSDDDDYDSDEDAQYANDDDDDDDKDEEKQHTNWKHGNKKEEECIPCQMIASITGNGTTDHDDDTNVADEDTAQLAHIERYTDLFALKGAAITEAEWDLLDALDDKQRETSNLMKRRPQYKLLVPEAAHMFNEWKARHAPDKFRRKLYKLVSLSFVQSMISVMKHELKSNKSLYEGKNLIIVISNAQNMYCDLFEGGGGGGTKHVASNSKLLSYLFDGVGDIKRIDSKGAIYSMTIGNSLDEIIDGGYLHSFVSMTTIKYKETLVLFNRGCDKLYVSHAGYISKLSLALHDEDLHYFVPLFIPLKVGDCVNIEAFSSPDTGTIVSLWRNAEKNNIVYRIRSTQNVYYIMNYYKLVNRTPPKVYWYETRRNVIRNASVWNDVRLWKTQRSSSDPSDPSHPLHAVILALVESSKQAIASIESKLREMTRKGEKDKSVEAKKLAIQHKLQNTGAIFLFYKSVCIENKSEKVLEFERNDVNNVDENEKNEKGEKGEKSFLDLEEDECDGADPEQLEAESNPNGLSHLIKFLKRNKLIWNVTRYESPQRTSYDLFCGKALEILSSNGSVSEDGANRVFVCHMVETKTHVLESVNGKEETAMEIDNNNNNATTQEQETAMMDPDPYGVMEDEDSEWLTLEPEEDDVPRRDDSASGSHAHELEQHIVIKSSFECHLSYGFTMCSVTRPVLTVEDLMMMKKEKRLWSTEDHKLLTQFHAHHIYNKFDLLDKQLIHKLKQLMTHENNKNNKLKLLEKKFTEFTESVDKLLVKYHIGAPLTQYVIAGVQVTRNAKILQSYIDKFRRYNNKFDIITDAADAEVIESNTDRTMIVSYNPIQTVVVTSRMIKDVTHPIHLYRAAYDEKFYPRAQIGELNAEWMQTKPRDANIINALSTLLRYNKKYEIIMVPSSIHLSHDKFLRTRCEKVAPEHEAIADYRITFLYKGLLYRYDKKKAKKFLQKQQNENLLNIMKKNKDDLDDDDDDDKIFVDEIKFLLRLLHDNISEEEPDAMDPDENVFDINDNVNWKSGRRRILRASIKRKHTDRIFRWLNIGCGSCFLHETTGRSKEIGPKKGTDYEKEFPQQLQRAMFLYYIDCRVPFNEDIVSHNSQCAICRQLMIDPATIGNSECKHIFCKLCIQQWYFINYQRQQQQQQQHAFNNNNNNENNHNNNNNNLNTSRCPICRANVSKICVQPQFVEKMKKGIPTTIYQQIMEENRSRFDRQYLVDVYLRERERVLEAEQSHQQQHSNINLAQQMQNNPRLQYELAGHRLD